MDTNLGRLRTTLYLASLNLTCEEIIASTSWQEPSVPHALFHETKTKTTNPTPKVKTLNPKPLESLKP